jgi:glycosyltransferase involved in cell wall biosynthesis
MKEARTLRAAGHDIHVICGRFSRWGTATDAPLAAELGAVSSIPFGPSEATRATYLRQTLSRRIARAMVQCGVRGQNVLEAAHGPVVLDLVATAQSVRADLYVAHYVAGLPAAARAAVHNGAAYAFDAEDFHLGDLPVAPEHALEKRIIRAIEGRYLPGAAYMTAASPLIAEAYAETYGIPLPTVVLNTFPRSNAPDGPTPCGSTTPGPSLYWFSQTIGPGRGIETAVEAIARAESRPHLYLRGAIVAEYQSHLHALAAGAGVSDRLHFLDCASPGELERLGAAYDLGYVGETGETESRQAALTNKLFSYLLGGVPSLVTDIPAHRQIACHLGEAMTLFPVGDVRALAASLDRLFLDPQRLSAARAHSWRLGQMRYNWETEQIELLAQVARAISTRHLSEQETRRDVA